MAIAEYSTGLQKEAIIMIVLLLLLQWWSSHGCLEEERAALLQLQHSFNYPNGTSWHSWDMNVDCCKWQGVGCNDTTGRVNELDLYRDKSLGEWNFNASMFLPFQQLRQLNLRDNKIVCCTKNEGFERLQKLSNLEALYLDWNGLTNNVLSMFQGFHSLKNLSLSSNKLNGSIYMKDLVKIPNLEMLDLSGNNIEKFVSSEDIQSSSNISILWLSGGVCNGSSFELQSLKIFKSLKSLHLEINNFKGVIFPQDGLNKLEELFLDYSYTDENFLLSLGGIRSLRLLSLKSINYETVNIQSNRSSFELQPLKAFKSLKSLHLEYSNFKGILFPQDDLNKLEELFLDGSDMDKNFLLSLGGHRSLRLLSLQGINYVTLNNQSFLNSVANITSLESLVLTECELTGSIDELCKLKNLQKLDLRYNNINGNLPSCLANLTLLQKLDLGINNISGTLPPCLANLTLLQYLDLSSNHFTGNISASPLKSFTSIEYLSIEDNHFQIPISLSPFLNHSKLKYLHADGNDMYAESDGVDNNLTPKFQLQELALFSTYGEGGVSFPRFLHHQYDLRYLDLSGIQMRGAGFSSWLLDNNTNLERLSLSNCSLSGPMHLPIHPHSKLDSLDISNNQFYGHIPREIGRYFPMLFSLYLHRNNFTGKIPNSLSNCSLLQSLDLSYNNLSGKIPELIGNMSSLLLLDLSNNNLSGSLPSIFTPPQASYISLSHNRLEGTFPDVLTYSPLFTLDLSHNHLSGGIPKSIKNLSRLTYLLLNHNNFEGEVPTYLWKMMLELKAVDLSHNRLGNFSIKNDTSETSYGYGTDLMGMTKIVDFGVKGNTYKFLLDRLNNINFIGLDLSSNNLTCPIPSDIGNKEGMKTLNLSHNNLIGHISLSFSNMTELESLDLSYNNLNGTLPPQLVQLKFLEVFSVAYNNISGKTPERVAQFATFDETSYQGNPFLCGLPLPKNCTPTVSSSTKESSTDDEGFIDKEVFQISFWVTFTIILLGIVSILYINPYWRQAWFYFIESTISTCCYYLVDHPPFLPKFRNT